MRAIWSSRRLILVCVIKYMHAYVTLVCIVRFIHHIICQYYTYKYVQNNICIHYRRSCGVSRSGCVPGRYSNQIQTHSLRLTTGTTLLLLHLPLPLCNSIHTRPLHDTTTLLNPPSLQQLIDRIDRDLTFALETEHDIQRTDVSYLGDNTAQFTYITICLCMAYFYILILRSVCYKLNHKLTYIYTIIQMPRS